MQLPDPAQNSSGDDSSSPLVVASALTKAYGSSIVVKGVTLSIARGETLGLVGESGSGKSTVARMILRLTEPTTGSLHFAGINLLQASSSQLRTLRRRMQIVFQDPYAALNPRMRVREILAEPFAIHGKEHLKLWDEDISGSKSGDVTAHALISLLRQVGLDESAMERYPHEFSGGQRQRINIARAIALRPELLVLDEPVSALDVSVGAQVINLLRDLQRRYGMTYLFISHSMPLVRYLCDRVAVMQHGALLETGPAIQICEHPQHPYTQALIRATPEFATQ